MRKVNIDEDIIDGVAGICMGLFSLALVCGTCKTMQEFWYPQADKNATVLKPSTLRDIEVVNKNVTPMVNVVEKQLITRGRE